MIKQGIKLGALLNSITAVTVPESHPALKQLITALKTNSQDCEPGDLFIGMPGTRVDGGRFWPEAIAAGAVAAVVSPEVYQAYQTDPTDVEPCLIRAEDVVQACGQIAVKLHNYPTQALKLVGVTGTNGKTTTSHLLEFFLNQAHQTTALLGTLYSRWPGFEAVATHTTPFATVLQGQLAGAVAAGCSHGVMEVSSHALAQRRVLGCTFAGAVFTNLTQDHLDYHRDMEDYFGAKALLFEPDYLQGRAIINWDDDYGRRLLERLGDRPVWTYSVTDSQADLWMSELAYGATGVTGNLHTPQGTVAFASPLIGQFNLANLLAAMGSGLSLGLDLAEMVAALPQFEGVPGRMERVQLSPNPETTRQDITVIVDYAHTPDSLENLLKASRPFIAGQMICVFGCGGDRDRTKRPKMGAIAAALADQLVVTSDNPRTEDPQKILADVVAGIPAATNSIVVADRAEAIRHSILTAKPGDGVLLAGKGHEDYQILGTEKIHFDDREQAQLALRMRLGPG
jgi:UDP-N-acetylmuramoyl-L-alanyl-D-glutamate--2,6-diaminopimelate ligase